MTSAAVKRDLVRLQSLDPTIGLRFAPVSKDPGARRVYWIVSATWETGDRDSPEAAIAAAYAVLRLPRRVRDRDPE